MGRAGRQRGGGLSPERLRSILGDSAQLIAWMDAEAGAAELRDYSGNGHLLTPTALEFETRPLAPGLAGRSGFYDGVTSRISTGSTFDFLHQGAEGAASTTIYVGNARPLSQWNLGSTFSVFNTGTGLFWRVDNRGGGFVMEARLSYYDGAAVTVLGSVKKALPEPDGIHEILVSWSDQLGVIRLYHQGTVIDEQPFAQVANARPGDHEMLIGSRNNADHFHGGMQNYWLASSFVDARLADELAHASGVKGAPAFYQPFYVSEHTDSTSRYFAEYVDKYHTAVAKPAVEVWPRRRYGQATAMGVKGAHDGVFQAGMTGDGAPLSADFGQSIHSNLGQLEVPNHPDFDFGAAESFTVSCLFRLENNADIYRMVDNFGGGTGWVFEVTGSGQVRLWCHDGIAPYLVQSVTTELGDGQAHHAAATLDRTTEEISVFVDGQLENTASIAGMGSLSTADPLQMSSVFRNFPDELDAIAIAPGLLSASEIAHLHGAAFNRDKRLSKAELEAL